jgi:hypothetical protein
MFMESDMKRTDDLELAVYALRLWDRRVYSKVKDALKAREPDMFFELCETVCIPTEVQKKLWKKVRAETAVPLFW